MNRVGARNVTPGPAAWPRWPSAWLALTALGACAIGGGDGGGEADAGPGDCRMRIAVSPEVLQAPVGIELTASIESLGGGDPVGLRSHTWRVLQDSTGLELTEIEVTPLEPSNARIWFQADSPGVYYIGLQGMVGALPCTDATLELNVSAADGVQQEYRLRVIPRGGQALPVQEIPQRIPVGEDVSLGTLPLAAGVAMTGTVEDERGEPLEAYVRVTPRGATVPWFVESFAGADGGFAMQLQSARYDVLVVPSAADRAPLLIEDQVAAPPWQLVVPAAPALTGTISDTQSRPLAGAQVSVRAGDVPGALALSGADGAFAVPVRPADALAVTVVPPADSGLPWLELPVSSALAGKGGPLAISYAPDLTAVTVAPVARDASGEALGNARATWIARPLERAGELSAGSANPLALALTGTARVTVTAAADGAFPALALPAAVYDVILEPAAPGALVTLLALDLAAGGAPDSLSAALPATVTGTVTDAAGQPVAGAEVTALPLGLLTGSADAGARAITAGDGSFTLAVTGGGSYELLLESRAPGHGSTRVRIDAPASGEARPLGALALAPAFVATGRLVSLATGAGVAGVTLQLICATCSAPGDAPVAEAVSDAFGDFALRIPAPADASRAAAD